MCCGSSARLLDAVFLCGDVFTADSEHFEKDSVQIGVRDLDVLLLDCHMTVRWVVGLLFVYSMRRLLTAFKCNLLYSVFNASVYVVKTGLTTKCEVLEVSVCMY